MPHVSRHAPVRLGLSVFLFKTFTRSGVSGSSPVKRCGVSPPCTCVLRFCRVRVAPHGHSILAPRKGDMANLT